MRAGGGRDGRGGAGDDLLREAGLRCELVAVTFTAGDRAARRDGMWRVPKRDLILGLQIMFETGALRMAAKMRDGAALVEEMMNMRVKVGASGNDGYAAWREGTRDDLVLAVALACWCARRGEVGERAVALGVE